MTEGSEPQRFCAVMPLFPHIAVKNFRVLGLVSGVIKAFDFKHDVVGFNLGLNIWALSVLDKILQSVCL